MAFFIYRPHGDEEPKEVVTLHRRDGSATERVELDGLGTLGHAFYGRKLGEPADVERQYLGMYWSRCQGEGCQVCAKG